MLCVMEAVAFVGTYCNNNNYYCNNNNNNNNNIHRGYHQANTKLVRVVL